MRTFGALCLLVGLLAFFYSSSQVSGLAPVPDGLTISDSLRYPAGRWEMGRYAGLAIGAVGIILSLFPKGR